MLNTYPPRGIARIKDLEHEYGLGRVQAWRLQRDDEDFPQRVPIIGKTFGWYRHELDFYFDLKREKAGK